MTGTHQKWILTMKASGQTARLIGILYLSGTISGFTSVMLTDAIRRAPDILLSVAGHENQMILGALFVLVMGLALAMVPVVAFPVLRIHNETLARGYVVLRSGLEAVRYMANAVSWLLLLPVSQIYRSAGSPDAPILRALGEVLFNAEEIADIGALVFCLGGWMFYYVLYRAKLVPRWLSGWGLLAIGLNFVQGLMAVLGFAGQLSTASVVMELPIAIQEMVLAVWLMVRGFNPSIIQAREELS